MIYAVVQDSNGQVVNVVEWDGVSDWSPPAGTSAVLAPTGEEDPPVTMAYVNGWRDGDGFHFPTPGIDSLDLVTGAAAGGTTVTVTGYNLDLSDVVVKFGGVAATNITNQTKTSLQCDTPAHAVGVVDVTIENGEGLWTGRSSLTGGFTYA